MISIRLRVATALSEIVVGTGVELFVSKQVVQYAGRAVLVVR